MQRTTSEPPDEPGSSCVPSISRIYAHVNKKMGPDHWDFKRWNPVFGNIDRYKLISLIGKGAYSEVFAGTQDNENICAIKILKPVNNDRIRRELKILTILKGRENILNLIDIVFDPNTRIISLITDFVPNTPCKSLIGKLYASDIKMYMYQLLSALDFTHSKGIMHRDIKPANILCQMPISGVVLADWGLAEFYHPEYKYSPHVGTKYYKAPELILQYGFYNYLVDIWAAGVTFLELLSKKIHVFNTTDPDNMLLVIGDLLGGKKIVELATNYRIKINSSISSALYNMPGKGIESVFPRSRRRYMSDDALDLLNKMLTIDPEERITAADALKHPYFNDLNKANDVDGTNENRDGKEINTKTDKDDANSYS